jgi:hypothetical protein
VESDLYVLSEQVIKVLLEVIEVKVKADDLSLGFQVT